MWNPSFAKQLLGKSIPPTRQENLQSPSLKEVTADLLELGYETYFVGQDTLLPIAGDAWHDIYEVCRDPLGAIYNLPYNGLCFFTVAVVQRGHLPDSFRFFE